MSEKLYKNYVAIPKELADELLEAMERRGWGGSMKEQLLKAPTLRVMGWRWFWANRFRMTHKKPFPSATNVQAVYTLESAISREKP